MAASHRKEIDSLAISLGMFAGALLVWVIASLFDGYLWAPVLVTAVYVCWDTWKLRDLWRGFPTWLRSQASTEVE